MKLAKFFPPFAIGMVLAFSSLRAPAQTNFWQQTNGPLGATINAIAVNQTNGNVFAAVQGVGMIRSTNRGASWSVVNGGLTSNEIWALLVNNNGHIFVGTSQGVFRSTDNGTAWAPVNNGLPNVKSIYALAVNSSGHVFAGLASSGSGVYRSVDNGNSWTAANTGLPKFDVRALAISANGNIFAGMNRGGVYRSADNGGNWTRASTGLTDTVVVALAVNASGHVFAGTAGVGSNLSGIFRTTDGGGNWSKVFAANIGVQALAVNSRGDILAGTSGSGIQRSLDNGNSWTAINNGLYDFMVNALAIYQSADEIFAGLDCGVFRSADRGDNWTSVNTGLIYTQISSLAINQVTGHIFAGMAGCGVYRSIDNGANWDWVGLPNAAVNTLLINTNGDLIAGVGSFTPLGTIGEVYRSTDNGASWERITPVNDVVYSLAVDPSGRLYAGTGFFQLCGFSFCDYGDIFRSADNGRSWTKVASKLDDYVQAIAIRNSNGQPFAGTREGIFRLSGSGFWNKIFEADVRTLAINQATGDLFAGTAGGIFRSTDNGEFWTLVNSLPNNFTFSLVINAQGHIFAGTQKSGVLRSLDTGATWTAVNSGLTNANVGALATNARGDMFAGTSGNGVFRAQLATGVRETANAIPATFALAQNYPNPFNPSTVIQYELPQAVEVQLVVFDLTGRRVRALVQQKQQAGRYEIAWDGRNEQGEAIASGLYIYQMRTGDPSAGSGQVFVQARRMALVR